MKLKVHVLGHHVAVLGQAGDPPKLEKPTKVMGRSELLANRTQAAKSKR